MATAICMPRGKSAAIGRQSRRFGTESLPAAELFQRGGVDLVHGEKRPSQKTAQPL